jgi:hypothetical protein
MSVATAVEEFLDGRELDDRERVLGEIARALAGQLDSACEAGTARGLSAGPPLARRLAEVLDALVVREGEEMGRAAIEAEQAERRQRRRQAATWAAKETPNGRSS